MWKCTKCDTINQSEQESCIICGHARSENKVHEQSFFIEKLSNSALLLEEFGVLPNLNEYNIDSAILLQILLEVEFNLKTVINSYQIQSNNGEVYYSDGADFIWQYFDSDGGLKWLLEREFRKNISYICIYNECMRLTEIDLHFEVDTENDSRESKCFSYELQLTIKDDWISSSLFIITRTIPCKDFKRVYNAKRDMRLQAKLSFNEYGNLIDTAQIFLNGESAVEYHLNNQGTFCNGILIFPYPCNTNDEMKILRFDMNLNELS